MKNRNEQFASEPYGLALKRILSERKISISTLAQRLDLTSRTTIHRILAGSSKLESVEKLHRRITENQLRLHFSDEDMLLLQQALERCRYGEQGWTMRKAVMDLIIRPEPPEPAVPCVCCASTEPAWCGRSIESVVEALAGYAEAEILLLNAAYPPLLTALQKLLAEAEAGGLRVHVRHVLSSTSAAFVEMQQFVHLQPLMADPHYVCYRRRAEQEEMTGTTSAEQSLIICKRSRAGMRTVDRVSFFSDRSFAYCTGLPDDDGQLTQYYAVYGQMLIEKCTCLNPNLTPEQEIANLLALNAEFAQYEQCWSQILIKPDLCISQIPTEYMMRLIRDSGYLGLSPDAPEIEEFERVHRQRYENFVSNKHGYVFIFSEAGMRRFMETGRLSDHVPGLPAFTPEERRAILEGLIKLSQEKPGILLYMFRDELAYTNIVVNLFNDEKLYVGKAYAPDHIRQQMHCITDMTCIYQIRSVIRRTLMAECSYDMEEILRRVWEIING